MKSGKIMIVDEAEANALFFAVVLKELGYDDVITATSGTEALARAKGQPPQFLVVAWEMKEMPGTVFVQRFRQLVRRKHVPYLIYSKRMSQEDLVLARELGLKNVLSLPLDRERAKQTIQQILQEEEAVTPEEQRLRKIEACIADQRPAEALKLFDGRLRRKGPYFARAQMALGQIWLMTNQLPKAEEALKLALEEDPAAVEAQNLLANVYSRSDRHDDAIALLTKMTEASPKNLTTLLNLGSTFVDADRHDDAKKVFGKVAAIDPDAPALKDEKGKLAFKEGDVPLAAKLLSETQNGDAIVRHFNNLAILLTHQSKFDKAIETYESAIKLMGEKAKVHALRYNLGLALAKKGALAQSFVELARSYKGDPTFEKAYAALARVGKQMAEKGLAYDRQLAREVNELRRSSSAQGATADKPAPGAPSADAPQKKSA